MNCLGFGRFGCLGLDAKRVVFLLLAFMLLPALLFKNDDRWFLLVLRVFTHRGAGEHAGAPQLLRVLPAVVEEVALILLEIVQT